MPVVAHLYNDFEKFDFANPGSGMVLALVSSGYTFNAADTVSTVGAFETTGSGYAELTGCLFIQLSNSAGVQLYGLQHAGSPAVFAAFTTTDWRHLVVIDSNHATMMICVDTGVTNTSAADTLDVSGAILSLTQ